jgi:hypothetical protein
MTGDRYGVVLVDPASNTTAWHHMHQPGQNWPTLTNRTTGQACFREDDMLEARVYQVTHICSVLATSIRCLLPTERHWTFLLPMLPSHQSL